MQPITIGIVGCGVISDSYLKGAARSAYITVKSVADMRPEAAAAKAREYNVLATTPDALLADPDISIVINLTVPLAHAAVNRAIVAAGKHVYAEKPLCAEFAEARDLLALAAKAGVRVGGAPDTFLGASHQACRRAIDAGRVGKVIAGAATVLSHGMEHWHPNPDFFFIKGGGPILDLGPYYVTDLVQLLGPVKRVAAETTIGNPVRTITSQPRAGEQLKVEIETTATALLSFASGAAITLTASWDVWKNKRLPFELYGIDGSLLVPDPNFFGGTPEISEHGADWSPLDITAHPFHIPNRTLRDGREVADYRIIGLLDMAAAIQQNRPHRASGELTTHVLEVLEAIATAGAERRWVDLTTTCQRPAPVALGTGEEVFAA
jgi:predicted dehydrogenase